MKRTAANLHPVTLKPSEEQVQAWDAAAKEAAMTRHRWAMAILDAAAGISKLPRHLKRVVRL